MSAPLFSQKGRSFEKKYLQGSQPTHEMKFPDTTLISLITLNQIP